MITVLLQQTCEYKTQTFHCQIFVKQKGTEIRISEMFGIDNIIMHKIHNFLLTQETKILWLKTFSKENFEFAQI